MKKGGNNCPTPSKKAYSSEEEAYQDASLMSMSISVYPCVCGSYHFTSSMNKMEKEAKSPAAIEHKRKYETEYESSPARKKYRRELEGERRKRGVAGKGGKDMSHTKTGKIVPEDPHTNRARSHPSVGSTLKMVVVKAPLADLPLNPNEVNVNRRFELTGLSDFNTPIPRGQAFASSDRQARGLAVPMRGPKQVIDAHTGDGHGPHWALPAFEHIAERGEGKGRKYLEEMVRELKQKRNMPVRVIGAQDHVLPFWDKMTGEGVVDSAHSSADANDPRPEHLHYPGHPDYEQFKHLTKPLKRNLEEENYEVAHRRAAARFGGLASLFGGENALKMVVVKAPMWDAQGNQMTGEPKPMPNLKQRGFPFAGSFKQGMNAGPKDEQRLFYESPDESSRALVDLPKEGDDANMALFGVHMDQQGKGKGREGLVNLKNELGEMGKKNLHQFERFSNMTPESVEFWNKMRSEGVTKAPQMNLSGHSAECEMCGAAMNAQEAAVSNQQMGASVCTACLMREQQAVNQEADDAMMYHGEPIDIAMRLLKEQKQLFVQGQKTLDGRPAFAPTDFAAEEQRRQATLKRQQERENREAQRRKNAVGNATLPLENPDLMKAPIDWESYKEQDDEENNQKIINVDYINPKDNNKRYPMTAWDYESPFSPALDVVASNPRESKEPLKDVGRVDLRWEDDKVVADRAFVEKPNRRQGINTAMYQLLDRLSQQKHGRQIEPSKHQSPNAKDFWESDWRNKNAVGNATLPLENPE